MIDQDFIRNLSEKAAEMFPAAQKGKEKLEKDLYQMLQRSLSHLQLVSQEEFKSQLNVLEQAKQKIDFLEKRLEAMEQSDDKTVE